MRCYTAYFVLITSLSACLVGGNENPCTSNIEVVDEVTGLVRLGTGEACSTNILQTRRPRMAHMAVVELPEGSEDPCEAIDAQLVYVVDGLGDDLEFGPSDPPDDALVVVDQTADLQVGDWVDVRFWASSVLSDSATNTPEWNRRFQWGVLDSTEDEVDCFASPGQ